jgi:flagellin
MAITINSSVVSFGARRSFNNSTSALNTSLSRLASGLRVNSAMDDPSAMALSTRMTADILSMNSAIKNNNDAISLTQVAEGALAETVTAIQRMRELAVQANTATISVTDQNNLQLEVTELMAEIQRIATTTKFNGLGLIDGGFTSELFQIGAGSGQTIKVTIASAQVSPLGLSTPTQTMSIGSGAEAATGDIDRAITRIDDALDSVSTIRAEISASQSRFEAVVNSLTTVSNLTSAARSRIIDADIAEETANMTKNLILQRAAVAIIAQANQQPSLAIKLLEGSL